MDQKQLYKEIQKWKKFGEECFYIERYGEWLVFLSARIQEGLSKVNLNTLMEVVKTIDNEKNFEKAQKELEKGTNKETYTLTLNGITLFAKNGAEFYEFVSKNLEPRKQEMIKYFKKQNLLFARNEEMLKFVDKKLKEYHTAEMNKKNIEVKEK